VVVHSTRGTLDSGAGPRVLGAVTTLLRKDPRLSEVAPMPGASLSQDHKTAVVLAGAGVDTNEMVRVATDLKGGLQGLSTPTVQVNPTGSSLLWSDSNDANLKAMMKSELFSWPVTIAILVLAFGALVAAGLPLLLTLAGLVASAGSLVLINHFVPVSVWAMNFAMMFSLALGIDYALFLVVRYRAARRGQHESAREAVAETMDTASKAVLLSGATVLVSLSAVLLVPSPAFRSMAGGIMLSVLFVLAATLNDRINRLALPWVRVGEHRSPAFARWGERLWRAAGVGRGIAGRADRPGGADHRTEDGDALDQGAAGECQRAHRIQPGTDRLRPRRARHAADRHPRRRRRGNRSCAGRRLRLAIEMSVAFRHENCQ
jgi:putative drug exporter of the RND superfamily